MRKTLAIAALAAVTVTSSLIVSTSNADAAHFRRWGPGLGFVAAGAFVAGAVIANSAPYERCGWVYHCDRRGNVIGRAWGCVPY